MSVRRLVVAAASWPPAGARRSSATRGSLDPLSDVAAPGQDAVTLPLKEGSLRFAVIGDTGTATRIQIELGRQMAAWQERVGFKFVLMTGDNIYGADTAAEMKRKFEDPYAALLAKDVKFYAVARATTTTPTSASTSSSTWTASSYYTFRPKMGVRFFALDSNYIDQKQLDVAGEGARGLGLGVEDRASSTIRCTRPGGNHGPALSTREVLEPIFVKHGVSVVLTGHEHFYERIKPQKGILHFISGGGGKLRPGDIKKDPQTAKGFDTDLHFLMMEIDGDDLWFQAVSRTGKTVDSGTFRRVAAGTAAQ